MTAAASPGPARGAGSMVPGESAPSGPDHDGPATPPGVPDDPDPFVRGLSDGEESLD